MDKKYNSKGNWWYEGAVCEHDGCDHSLDLPEHHEYPNHNSDCRVKWCREHYYTKAHDRNRRRRIHPDTGTNMRDWINSKAQGHYKALYGSSCRDRKADPKWRECHDKAKADAEAIEWVYPNAGSNVVPLIRHDEPAGKPMRTREGGTLQGEAVPEGWVYVVQNPDVPHILKIGKTYPDGIRSIMQSARRFGRAHLLERYYFDEALEAERVIHEALSEWNMRNLGYDDCGKELFKVRFSIVQTVIQRYMDSLDDSSISQG